MEFKGTKGEWYVMGEKYFRIESKNIDPIVTITHATIATVNSKNDTLESKYNALLISKAPEMLDMLKEVSKKLNGNGFPYLKEKIDNLIKKSTIL